MKKLKINTKPEVETVLNKYPATIKEKILYLRQLIFETADKTEEISELEETLKWGEPSYLTKIGSTIRIDWKEKSPDQYAMYFKCTSKLVPTFKTMFGDLFEYEGNRAILFQMNDKIPELEFKKCIRAALTYHKVKLLPNLGMI